MPVSDNTNYSTLLNCHPRS